MSILFSGILKIEGGLTNDKNDKGGLTKYGISQARFPNVDIANLTESQALELYRVHFWDNYHIGEVCNQLTANLIFTLIVHSEHNGVKIIQRACNDCGSNINIDGRIGIATLTAINNSNQQLLQANIRLAECRYYLAICDHDKSQQKFFRGWIRRALS